MKNLLSRSLKEKNSVSFLLIKLKQVHFKLDVPENKKNDLSKLETELVKKMGSVLETYIRETDMICRFNKESMLLMIPETVRKGALRFQARITDNLNQVLLDFEEGRNLYSDLEFKTIVFPDDGKTFSEIFTQIESGA
jgi:PleD family two-component response regulator